jgi:hypothetical protein
MPGPPGPRKMDCGAVILDLGASKATDARGAACGAASSRAQPLTMARLALIEAMARKPPALLVLGSVEALAHLLPTGLATGLRGQLAVLAGPEREHERAGALLLAPPRDPPAPPFGPVVAQGATAEEAAARALGKNAPAP